MAPKRTTRSSPATITPTTTPVTDEKLRKLIAHGVTDVLAERDATRSRNGEDNPDSGTGVRRQAPLARECTYLDFMKCKPLYLKGSEGIAELTQWFERMKIVFRISNCTMENQIKFATCTLLRSALTWWNSHVRTVGHDVAYAMTWTNLKKKLTDRYCPSGKIKKLDVEMWNLKVKGTDVVNYNQRFQKLALMYARMFPEESDKIERYVDGLPDMIHGSVMASKPKAMQDSIEFSTELMDKKISTLAERQAKNKRKLDNNNETQQQPPKKQGVAIAYTIGPDERKKYARTLPLCNKYKFHHNSQCTVKYTNCKRVGHLTQHCRSLATTSNQRNPTCYECGNQGHYKSDCMELKNQNHRNQARSTGARGMALDMIKHVTAQEVNEAIFSMGNDKSSGPDGYTACFFKECKRGLRQGDPLSPYLFTLIMEVLTLMLRRKVRDSEGFRYHHYCSDLEIINLCFADDLFIFAHGDPYSAKVIMEAMKEFMNVSGLTHSLPKSTTYFCNVLNHTKLSILQILPFDEGRLPVKYLGVPLVSSRLQLVRSVLGSMHVYWASILILPSSILLDIEQLIRGFLWCHGEIKQGSVKVAWEVVCLPKNEGGLGVRRLDLFNKALMIPHIWNIITRKESLWVKWIHQYKLRDRHFLMLHIVVVCRGAGGKFSNFDLLLGTILGFVLVMVQRVVFGLIGGPPISLLLLLYLIVTFIGLDLIYLLRLKMRYIMENDHGLLIGSLNILFLIRWMLLIFRLRMIDWNGVIVMHFIYGLLLSVWDSLKHLAGLHNVNGSISIIVEVLILFAKQRSIRSVVAKLVVAACSYYIWSETRPPMLEGGSYVPWSSRFLRYIDHKKEMRKFLKHSIHVGPYEFKKIAATETGGEKTRTDDDLTCDDLKQYETDINAMNLILLSIPNDIYNSVDACENAKDMWERQYEGLVNASRVKRVAKTYEPLAIVANTYESSLYSLSLLAYYVSHPPSTIGYDEDYQGEAICDDQEDSLTTTMMLLARAITQCYSTPTNNRLRSSNTRNQAIVQADRVDIQCKNVGGVATLTRIYLMCQL
uniref:CCHC-type domain-containing protein n=1 Tax=Tanacetum cinerariifolium TaxID=118510 RepID=A0A6L2NH03_TANCI|nr:hypothetical protein [Tanacetum cinerariifolium]